MSKDPALIEEGRNVGRDVERYHGVEYGSWVHTAEAQRVMERMRKGEIETYIPNTVIVADLKDYFAEHVLPYINKPESSAKPRTDYGIKQRLAELPIERRAREARERAEEYARRNQKVNALRNEYENGGK